MGYKSGQKKKAKILLVFPPFDYSILIPEIGIPVLTANLKKQGYDVKQLDLNIELIHRYLGSLKEIIRTILQMMDKNDFSISMDFNNSETFLNILASSIIKKRSINPDKDISVMEWIKKIEITSGKSCQIRQHQLIFNWNTELKELNLHDELEKKISTAIANSGLNLKFRKDLLRIINHTYLKPHSYALPDVLNAVSEKNVILNDFYDKILEAEFSKTEPDIVGISIWSTSQLIPSLILARKVKQLLKNVKVIAGGAWCTYAQSIIINSPELFSFVDLFFIHESEKSLSIFLEAHTEKHLPAIPNTLVFNRGKIIQGELLPPSPLSEIEQPVYEGFPMNLYPEHQTALRLFRGCYWSKCIFCNHTILPYFLQYSQSKNTLMSQKLVKRIIKQIRRDKKLYSVKSFTIADNLIPPSIMNQFSKIIIKNRLQIEWNSLARFEKEYTPEFCKHLYKGGCRQLDLGLETACQKSLNNLHKGISLKVVLKNLKNLKSAGIKTKVFIINYPGQTPEEYESTLKFLRAHSEFISEIAISRFSPACGTRAYRNPHKLGIKYSNEGTPWLDVFSIPFEADSLIPFDELISITNRYFPNYW